MLNSDVDNLSGYANVDDAIILSVGSKYRTLKDGYWYVGVGDSGVCGGAIYKNASTEEAMGGIAISSGHSALFVKKGLYIATQSLTSNSVSKFYPIDTNSTT